MTARAERVLVCVATYNERANLPLLLEEIRRFCPQVNILVIDDNSPDGTGRLADDLAEANPRVGVLHRPAKLGLGSAILAGMRVACDNGYDLFANMDADFSHQPRYLPALLAGMDRHDLMIGSRYVAGGGTVDWPWPRRLMSRAINLLVRVLFRIPVADASGGYRCYRVDMLRRIQLRGLASAGYSFQEEVLHRCWRAGCRLGETPILFADRRAGVSKLGIKEMLLSSLTLFWLGVQAFVAGPQRLSPMRRQK